MGPPATFPGSGEPTRPGEPWKPLGIIKCSCCGARGKRQRVAPKIPRFIAGCSGGDGYGILSPPGGCRADVISLSLGCKIDVLVNPGSG